MTRRKKTAIIISSVALAIAVAAAATLAVTYCPRRLSAYIKMSRAEAAYLIGVDEAGEEKQEYLSENERETLLKELKNIKIARRLSSCKCVTAYAIALDGGGERITVYGHKLVRRTQSGVSAVGFKPTDKIYNLYMKYLNKAAEEHK